MKQIRPAQLPDRAESIERFREVNCEVSLGQAADHLASRMHYSVDGFLIGYGPGFNAFCDIRADLVRTFLSAPVLRAEFAVHIFFLVGKSSDVHETSCG